MAYVKFVKGLVSQYTAGKAIYDTNGSIFFATDDGLIFANGLTYGISAAEKQKLAKSIKTVEILPAVEGDASLKLKITYTDDTTSNVEIPAVTATRNGLMTPTQKGNLESAYEQVITGGSGTIKNQVAENKVSSSDGTVTVTPGSTDPNNPASITGTDVKVNIDGTTIVKNASGVLSVASAALTQYVGDKKAIEISAVDSSTNEKTISLKIKSGDQILSASTVSDAADGLTATVKVKALTAAEISALSDGANVKEAYKLVGINDAAITGSDVVKVYKDSALLSVALLHADLTANPVLKPTYSNGAWTDIASASQTEANLALCFAYQLADGSISVEAIPVGSFLRETEFAKGLAWNSTTGKVEGVVDGTSESFLTVGADGFKLSGVQDAINTAKAAGKTTLTEVAADSSIPATGAPKVVVTKSTESDGHFNYTVEGQDLASATKLTAEETRAKNAEAAIDGAIGLTKGASDETRTYSPESGANYGASTTTVKDRIAAIDGALKAVDDASVESITVNGRAATVSNNAATVEIGGDDIKIDESKTGDTKALLNAGGAIYDNDTLKAAITALEAQLLWYEANDTVNP